MRLWTAIFILRLVDYFARHVYNRGRFARSTNDPFRPLGVPRRPEADGFSSATTTAASKAIWTISSTRLGSASNVVFSNFIGYRRTNWLIFDGCADEPKHKELERHHTIATQAWYKAYPGLTAVDLERNIRIRRGIESPSMGDKEAREWAALL